MRDADHRAARIPEFDRPFRITWRSRCTRLPGTPRLSLLSECDRVTTSLTPHSAATEGFSVGAKRARQSQIACARVLGPVRYPLPRTRGPPTSTTPTDQTTSKSPSRSSVLALADYPAWDSPPTSRTASEVSTPYGSGYPADRSEARTASLPLLTLARQVVRTPAGRHHRRHASPIAANRRSAPATA